MSGFPAGWTMRGHIPGRKEDQICFDQCDFGEESQPKAELAWAPFLRKVMFPLKKRNQGSHRGSPGKYASVWTTDQFGCWAGLAVPTRSPSLESVHRWVCLQIQTPFRVMGASGIQAGGFCCRRSNKAGLGFDDSDGRPANRKTLCEFPVSPLSCTLLVLSSFLVSTSLLISYSYNYVISRNWLKKKIGCRELGCVGMRPKGPEFGLMLCCRCLEIFNNFWTRGPIISFTTFANYVAGLITIHDFQTWFKLAVWVWPDFTPFGSLLPHLLSPQGQRLHVYFLLNSQPLARCLTHLGFQ